MCIDATCSKVGKAYTLKMQVNDEAELLEEFHGRFNRRHAKMERGEKSLFRIRAIEFRRPNVAQFIINIQRFRPLRNCPFESINPKP